MGQTMFFAYTISETARSGGDAGALPTTRAAQQRYATIPWRLWAVTINVILAFSVFLASQPCLAALEQTGALQRFIWSVRAASVSEAQLAQERLYLTLFNTGRLPVKEVIIEEGELPGDVVRRAGALVGEVTEAVEAMLCDLNPGVCQRVRASATQEVFADPTRHVAGFSTSGGVRWRAGAGQTLVVPDLSITQTTQPERNANLFQKKMAASISFEQVQQVPACLDPEESICVTDYAVVGQLDTATVGDLRQITAVRAPVVESVGPSAADPSPLFVLVPRLTVAVSLSEAPLPYFADIPNAFGYRFDDPDFERLLQAIGQNLSGGFAVDLKALPTNEPKYRRQRHVFEHFYNLRVHGSPPEFDASRGITIVVVDHLPNVGHCEFKGASIDLLAEPGTFPDEASTGGTTDATEAEIENRDAATCGEGESAFVPEDHGTHILGLAAAQLNNMGGAGLLHDAPNVKYLVIPINVQKMRSDYSYTLNLAASLRGATLNAVIVNLSWTYFPLDLQKGDVILNLIQETKDNVLWIVAAGDNGDDANEGICNARPACFVEKNVLSVVALETSQDSLLGNGSETDHGWKSFDLGAPGRNIWSTVGSDEYAPASGTSQATMIVTSAAALLNLRLRLGPRQTIERLVYTSRLLPELKGSIFGGAVDATAALEYEQDRIKLISDCTYLGKALQLKFFDGRQEIVGDFVIDVEDPVSGEPDKPVNFNLNQARRVFYDQQSDSYIAFFVRNPTEGLVRVSGGYGSERSTRYIKFFVEEARGEECNAAAGERTQITLKEMQDFIRRIP